MMLSVHLRSNTVSYFYSSHCTVHIFLLQKKEQLSGSRITCNNTPLVRESVTLPDKNSTLSAAVHETETATDDDNFVYDVYRTDDDQFDFQSLEHVLAIQALRFIVLHAYGI